MEQRSDAMEEIIAIAQATPREQDAYFASLAPDKTSSLLIEHLGAKPESATRNELIQRAKNYYYDDFKSLLDSCPKIVLHRDLLQAGFADLADNVINGDYD